MTVRKLIENLKYYNPDAEVEIVYTIEDDDGEEWTEIVNDFYIIDSPFQENTIIISV